MRSPATSSPWRYTVSVRRTPLLTQSDLTNTRTPLRSARVPENARPKQRTGANYRRLIHFAFAICVRQLQIG